MNPLRTLLVCVILASGLPAQVDGAGAALLEPVKAAAAAPSAESWQAALTAISGWRLMKTEHDVFLEGRTEPVVTTPDLVAAARAYATWEKPDLRTNILASKVFLGAGIGLPEELKTRLELAKEARSGGAAIGIGGGGSFLPLAKLRRSKDEKWSVLARELRRAPSKRKAEILVALMEHPDVKVRRAAVMQLARVPRKHCTPVIEVALKDEDAEVRLRALKLTERKSLTDVAPTLRRLEASAEGELKTACRRALCAIGDPESTALYVACLDGEDETLRRLAIRAVRQTKNRAAMPKLTALLADPEPAIRVAAARALHAFKAPDLTAKLHPLLEDHRTRRGAMDLLSQLGDATSKPAMVASLHDVDVATRREAVCALCRLGAEEVITHSKLFRRDAAVMDVHTMYCLNRIARPAAFEAIDGLPLAELSYRGKIGAVAKQLSQLTGVTVKVPAKLKTRTSGRTVSPNDGTLGRCLREYGAGDDLALVMRTPKRCEVMPLKKAQGHWRVWLERAEKRHAKKGS